LEENHSMTISSKFSSYWANGFRQEDFYGKMATTLLLKAALIQVSDYMHLGASGCNLQSRTQTHAVLVIGFYEFLGFRHVSSFLRLPRFTPQIKLTATILLKYS
jgi:hypothetical protein